MTGLEVAAIGGLVFNTGGQVAGAISQANAQAANGRAKMLQADELLSRQAINEQMIQEESQKAQLGYGAAFADTGREGGGIGGIIAIQKNTREQIANSRREAEFKAKMLRMGAETDLSLSSDIGLAGGLQGFGTLLTGGAKIYDYYKKPSAPSTLPGTGLDGLTSKEYG